MNRRDFLRWGIGGVAGLAVAACSRRAPGAQLPLGTPDALAGQVRALLGEGYVHGLQVFPGAQEFIAGREDRMPLGLVDPHGFSLTGGTPRIWLAAEGGSPGAPVQARYHAYGQKVEHDDPNGFYAAELAFPSSGLVDVLVAATTDDDLPLFGWATVHARGRATVPDVGEAAVAVATPTVDDQRGVANLCTRQPACPLHERSLGELLEQRQPVVYTISSPLLCTSRTCGPVLEEVLALHQRYEQRARFVHAEPYRGETATHLADAATAWRLESEPWTFVIDGDGVVAARFEGPVVADEIEPALRALLA